MSTIYVFTLESEGLAVVAGVNGVPLTPDPGGQAFNARTAINEWLLPEGNALTVRIDWPEDIDYEPGIARLSVSISVAAAGEETVPLAAVNWPLEGKAEAYPRSFRVPFALVTDPGNARPGGRLFREAAPPDGITMETREAAIAPVLELHSAFTAGDQNRVFALLRFRFSEIAAAYPDAEEDILKPAREAIEDLLAQREVVPEPLRPDELSLASMAAGRLFHVRGPGGMEAIRFAFPSGDALDIPVFVGFVDGNWVIAR